MTYEDWFAANADRLALHGLMGTCRDVWEAATAVERGACAQVCETFYNHEAKDCADAIRERSNVPIERRVLASARMKG
jgi:hypothetical protein